MEGIIGFEESQAVTNAFNENGHDFKSLDIQDCSGGNPDKHINGDFFKQDFSEIDFLGAHPVCKLLANSGVRWLASTTHRPGYTWQPHYGKYINLERYYEMKKAALMFREVLAKVKKVGKGYIEQPILHCYAMEIIEEKPTQVIQPWMFGHTTKKATMLWLVNLPKLVPTNIIPKEMRTDEIHKCPPGPEREKIRSKTFPGIAKAMATQWSVIQTP